MKDKINDILDRVEKHNKDIPSSNYILIRDQKMYLTKRTNDMTIAILLGDVVSADKTLTSEMDLFNIGPILEDVNEIEVSPVTVSINGTVIRVRTFDIDLFTDKPELFVTEDRKSFLDKIQLNESLYSSYSKGMNKTLFQVKDRQLSCITTNGLISTTTAFFDFYNESQMIYALSDKPSIKLIRPLLTNVKDEEVYLSLRDGYFNIHSDSIIIKLKCFEMDKSKDLKLWNFSGGETMEITKKDIMNLSKTIDGFGRANDMKLFKAEAMMGELHVKGTDEGSEVVIMNVNNPFSFEGPTMLLNLARLRLDNPIYINKIKSENGKLNMITLYSYDKSKFITIMNN